MTYSDRAAILEPELPRHFISDSRSPAEPLDRHTSDVDRCCPQQLVCRNSCCDTVSESRAYEIVYTYWFAHGSFYASFKEIETATRL